MFVKVITRQKTLLDIRVTCSRQNEPHFHLSGFDFSDLDRPEAKLDILRELSTLSGETCHQFYF